MNNLKEKEIKNINKEYQQIKKYGKKCLNLFVLKKCKIE